MRRRLPRGLRPRLLLALLLTSSVTLGIAATVLLSPLPDRLREQSAVNLRGAVLASRTNVENALRDQPKDAIAVPRAAEELRQRTDGRVLLLGPVLADDVLYDTSTDASIRGAQLTALRITDEGPDAPTPHDQRRDEVGDLARALARMQEELRRQEAARRAFVSTASHELRTPLTMLQGTMELLEEDLREGRLDEADGLRQIEGARTELNRLSALAGELLDLSRLDAAVPLRSEPVELGEIVRAVAAEFALRAEKRDTALNVVLPAAACWGSGDPDAIARVVRILVDNALRYGPPGEPVRIEARAALGRAMITVADTGPGIAPEERENIFERFHRGSRAGSSGGFGLGLAIGRELARRMGGELEVLDGDGEHEPAHPGTRFGFTLRTAPSPADGRRPDRDRVSA
jgi:signal transduction histidine kinase